MEDETKCCICLELLNSSAVMELPGCIHKVHTICGMKWINRSNTCPMCRHQVLEEELTSDSDDSDDDLSAYPLDTERLLRRETVLRIREENRRAQRSSFESIVHNFASPVLISDTLADVLGKEHGSYISLVNITKALCIYIKLHNLQDQNNKRIVHPDNLLSNIFGNSSLSYLEMQAKLRQHLII